MIIPSTWESFRHELKYVINMLIQENLMWNWKLTLKLFIPCPIPSTDLKCHINNAPHGSVQKYISMSLLQELLLLLLSLMYY